MFQCWIDKVHFNWCLYNTRCKSLDSASLSAWRNVFMWCFGLRFVLNDTFLWILLAFSLLYNGMENMFRFNNLLSISEFTFPEMSSSNRHQSVLLARSLACWADMKVTYDSSLETTTYEHHSTKWMCNSPHQMYVLFNNIKWTNYVFRGTEVCRCAVLYQYSFLPAWWNI